MKKIILNEIKISENGRKAEYVFTAPEEFKSFLANQEDFEYPYVMLPEGYDLNTIPEGVLAVPFVGNLMVLAAVLSDYEIHVDTLNKRFYDSISNIEAAFNKTYPYLDLKFRVKAKNLSDDKPIKSNKCSMFFTGGVDATSNLIENLDKKPLVINIFGGDVKLTDTQTYNNLDSYFNRLFSQLNLDYVFITSNFRWIFNERKLNKLCNIKLKPEDVGAGWWSKFAHTSSMAAIIAPLTWAEGIEKHYIGSTYGNHSKHIDANNDFILSATKLPNCDLISVDSDLTRTDKALKIIKFSEEHNIKFDLKVCWYRKASENCSHCEKCYRTILNILANHGDPNDYGFKFDENTCAEMKLFCETKKVDIEFYKEIQNSFLKEKEYWSTRPDMSWILTQKFKDRSLFRKFLHTLKIALLKIQYKITKTI